MAKKKKSIKPEEKRRVTYDMIKSNQFRVIHADGVFGGLGPGRNLFFTLFAERPAMPTQLTHELDESEGGMKLGKELTALRQSRGTVIRDLEVGVIMSPGGAAALYRWLKGKLEEAEKRGLIKREEYAV